MISLRAFRNDPHFADLFAHVHPICWPILWWQLNTLFAWRRREGIPDVLYSVNSWGFLTLRQAGARPDPGVYQPLPRTFRPLTDESWESDEPACLDPFILFCEAGRGRCPHPTIPASELPLIPAEARAQTLGPLQGRLTGSRLPPR